MLDKLKPFDLLKSVFGIFLQGKQDSLKTKKARILISWPNQPIKLKNYLVFRDFNTLISFFNCSICSCCSLILPTKSGIRLS